jgi:adenosine deaminase
MDLETWIKSMPKVELHVHLEGSVRPETLLLLAKRHHIQLPASTVEELRAWYTFTNFNHFIEIYMAISGCLRTPDDMELITREFLAGQAAQNIVYSEVTWTPLNQYHTSGMGFEEQLAAVNRASAWAEKELHVRMAQVIDIPRGVPVAEGELAADWAIQAKERGVVAFGLGGPEIGNPPEVYTNAFARTRAAGLPGVPHAGETAGPASMWGALRALQAVRIGHGIHCLEDPALVAELRDRQIPLEVCPTSNVCLKQARCIEEHPLPRLLAEGLFVTVGSDDPPMFNTTLTEEYLKVARVFRLGLEAILAIVQNGVKASFLPEAEKQILSSRIDQSYIRLAGK